MTLQLISPPYRCAVSTLRDEVPIGSIIIVDARCGFAYGKSLVDATNSAPWAPIVLLADRSRGLAALISLVQRGLQRVACCEVSLGENPNNPTALLRAVRERGSPKVEDLVDYLERRGLSRFGLEIVRESLITSGRLHSESSTRRHSKAAGLMLPHDWRSCHRLIQCLSQLDWQSEWSLERLGNWLGVDKRTLEGWSRKFLGDSIKNLGPWPAWEAYFELMLRHRGYFDASAGVAKTWKVIG